MFRTPVLPPPPTNKPNDGLSNSGTHLGAACLLGDGRRRLLRVGGLLLERTLLLGAEAGLEDKCIMDKTKAAAVGAVLSAQLRVQSLSTRWPPW